MQKKTTLTKNQHTKSTTDLNGKYTTKKNNVPSNSNLRNYTYSEISNIDTRASINDDYSDAEKSIPKAKEIDPFEAIVKKPSSALQGGGTPEARYKAAAEEMITSFEKSFKLGNQYKDFDTEVLYDILRKRSGVSLPNDLKNTEIFDQQKKNLASNPKWQNMTKILNNGGSKDKDLAVAELAEQLRKDNEELKLQAETVKQEAQQELQKESELNKSLNNKASDLESKLTQETKERERLAEEQKKKDEELAKLKQEQLTKDAEIEELQTKMRDSEGKSGTEKSELQAKIEALTKEKLAIDEQNLKSNLTQSQKGNIDLQSTVQEAEGGEEKKRATEREDALQQEIEELKLQNQQSEQEKRSQADLLNAEKLRNDQLQAEVEANKELEEAKNQPDQKSQQKDITFQPDSAKDKISGRAKEIGKSVADNLFIIAAMIGTIMALMSGAGLAVIIVAAVTPIAGMMVNKGINMIADQIERSQKNKEREQILELNQQHFLNQQQGLESQTIAQDKYRIEVQKNRQPRDEGEQDEEFNSSKIDDRDSTQGSEVDSIGTNNSNNGSEIDEDAESKSDIESQITITKSMKSVGYEMEDIDDIVKNINKESIVDLEEKDLKDLHRTVQEKFNLDSSKKDEISRIDLEKKHSKIEGLDLYGNANPPIDNSLSEPKDLAAEKAALKKQMGHSPTLTSEQVNASEIKIDGGINVYDIKSEIKEDANVVQAPEFTEAERKDGTIKNLLKESENIKQDKRLYEQKEKILENQLIDLEKNIKSKEVEKEMLSRQMIDLENKMKDAGISDESEKKTGLVGSETKRQKQFKEEIAVIEAKINLAKTKSNNPNIQDDGEKNKGHYEKKIKEYEEERSNLVQKNKEKDDLKKEMEELKKQLVENSKNEKDLQGKKNTLESGEMEKIKKEILKKNNEEKKVQQQIDNRKNAIKLENEKKAEALEAKKLQEEKKEAEKLQAIQKKKQEKYEKELADAKKTKAEAYKKAGILSKTEQKAAEGKLESQALDEDHNAILSQEKKAQEDALNQKLQARAKSKLDKSNQISGSKVAHNSSHELLEGLINVDDIDLSGASNTHSSQSFVVDANQSRSSGTSSHI